VIRLGLAVVAVALLAPPAGVGRVVFRDVTREAGLGGFTLVCGGPSKDYILESTSAGCAFVDFDRDGWLDIFLVNGSTLDNLRAGRPGPPSRLFRNRHDGTFEDVTERSGAGVRGWGMGVAAADVDGNGFPDLYVTNYGPNVLLLNKGDGTFQAADRGIAAGGWSTGAGFADPDRDGDLDLYVARYVDFDVARLPPPPGGNLLCKYRGMDVYCGPRGLTPLPDLFYRQGRDGRFADATREAGMAVGPYYGFGVVWGDYNNDGWVDLYVANDSGPNLLFVNRKDGTFSEEALLAGAAVSADGREQAGMGVDAGDYDNDGWLDLYVTNFSHDYNTLYRNLRDGSFADVSAATGHAQATFAALGWGTGFVDFDNDGWLDLFVANGHVYPQMDRPGLGTRYRQRAQLFLNQRGTRFVEIGEEAGLRAASLGRGAAFGDYDRDGYVDVLVNNLDGVPALLHNETRNRNHWLQFQLEGAAPRNRDAIGARVELRCGGMGQIREVRSGSSYASQNDLRVHFGLGGHAQVESVTVRWPDGTVEDFRDVGVDRIWKLRQSTGRAEPEEGGRR